MAFSVCIDMTGKKIGKLTVLRREGITENRIVTWLCRCDCGNEICARGDFLRRGIRTHCGCIKSKRGGGARKGTTWIVEGKGWSKVPEYQTWKDMRYRCLKESHADYCNYGARGITVCERWRDNFWNFYADMGPKPARGYTLDRIDNNGNYEPGNCRWATYSEQNRNKRPSRKRKLSEF